MAEHTFKNAHGGYGIHARRLHSQGHYVMPRPEATDVEPLRLSSVQPEADPVPEHPDDLADLLEVLQAAKVLLDTVREVELRCDASSPRITEGVVAAKDELQRAIDTINRTQA